MYMSVQNAYFMCTFEMDVTNQEKDFEIVLKAIPSSCSIFLAQSTVQFSTIRMKNLLRHGGDKDTAAEIEVEVCH